MAVSLTVLPYAVTAVPPLPDGLSQRPLRLTPAAGFAVQQRMVGYSQVIAHYAPSAGYFPLPWWAGFTVLCAYTLTTFRVATRRERADRPVDRRQRSMSARWPASARGTPLPDASHQEDQLDSDQHVDHAAPLGVGAGYDLATAVGAAVLGGVTAAVSGRGSVFAAAFPAGLVVFTGWVTLGMLWAWDVAERLNKARRLSAEPAVKDERLRFTAELHDIQDHHLQVIALKSELAALLEPEEDLTVVTGPVSLGAKRPLPDHG